MKKLTTIIAILFSLTAFAQKGGGGTVPSSGIMATDSGIINIPDSVKYISQRHILQSYKNLTEKLKPLEDKLTVSQYNRLVEGIQAAFEELIAVAMEEYKKKKPGK